MDSFVISVASASDAVGESLDLVQLSSAIFPLYAVLGIMLGFALAMMIWRRIL